MAIHQSPSVCRGNKEMKGIYFDGVFLWLPGLPHVILREGDTGFQPELMASGVNC